MTGLRIGVLGAARIAPTALVAPARTIAGVEVTAIAARDRRRAQRFAAAHGIERVLHSYQSVIDDPAIDAVYIPLPNGLHAQWVRAAIAAGKHVLCEKPFTANAAQAREIAAAAEGAPVVVMEAFHYRYHPLAARLQAIVAGELGEIRSVRTAMCFPLPRFGDIRYQFDLAGGALMDAGCYALHAARTFGAGEPTVAAAAAVTLRRDRRVDRAMTVELRYPGGAIGIARTSMWSRALLDISVDIAGEHGRARVFNFAAPQYYHRLTVTTPAGRRTERVAGAATYTHQLAAFVAATRGEPTNLTPPADSIATMELIDAAYRAAGLPVRG